MVESPWKSQSVSSALGPATFKALSSSRFSIQLMLMCQCHAYKSKCIELLQYDYLLTCLCKHAFKHLTWSLNAWIHFSSQASGANVIMYVNLLSVALRSHLPLWTSQHHVSKTTDSSAGVAQMLRILAKIHIVVHAAQNCNKTEASSRRIGSIC